MFIRKHWIPLSVFLVVSVCAFGFFLLRPDVPEEPISETQGLPSVISHGAERQKTSEPEKQNAPPFISYAQYRRDHKAWREKFKKAHTEWDQTMQDFLNASVEFRETLSDTEREQAMATLREAHEKRQAASEKLESLRQEEPVPPTPLQNN